MSELAVPEHGTQIERPTAPVPHPSALVQWAMEAREAAQIAESLSKTSFVPDTLRGKPADITAAILAGQELGLKPMATLRSMDVIKGTPALRAHAMRGLVQSHGHEIELVESTDVLCVMRGRRKGTRAWQEVVWTIERAQLLGLPNRNPEWKKQPRTMLIARASGEICRLIASDVLYAMPYAAEELSGDEPPEVTATFTNRPVTAAEITGRPAASDAAPELAAGPSDDDTGVSDSGPADIWATSDSPSEGPEWPAVTEPGTGGA